MKVIDYCGTATVRSTTSGGAVAALVLGFFALCFVIGANPPQPTAARSEVAQAPAVPPPAAPDPTPWWGPWVFGLLALVVIALVVLVLARLHHGAHRQAMALGYARPMLHGLTPPPPMLEPGAPPRTEPERVASRVTVERDRAR